MLVAGGLDASESEIATAELYDPATGKFSSTGSMLSGQDEAAGVLLKDGTVLVVDGETGNDAVTDAQRYDPETGAFSADAHGPFTTPGYEATLLPGGTVLFTGSYELSGVGDAMIYRP